MQEEMREKQFEVETANKETQRVKLQLERANQEIERLH